MLVIELKSYCYSALEQFDCFVLGLYWTGIEMPVGGNIFTSIILYLSFSVLISEFLFQANLGLKTTNILQMIFNLFYNLVKNMFSENILLKRSAYFPAFFSLFFYVLFINFSGLMPISYTGTSSFFVIFFMSVSYFLGLNLIGAYKHNWKLMNLFLPSGVPLVIVPMLILIETISYVSRVLSLSIRVFANMMSGHALIKILICFTWALLTSGLVYFVLALFPWFLITLIFGLETLIAFLQAYVFLMLLTIYLNDVLSEH